MTTSVTQQRDRSERACHGALIGSGGEEAQAGRTATNESTVTPSSSGGKRRKRGASGSDSQLLQPGFARPGRSLDHELEAGVAHELQVVGRAQPVLVVERRVDEAPGAVGEAQEVVARERAVEVRVVVLQVDPAAEGAARPQQAEALAEDLAEVGAGDVLAGVGAGDEVDRLGGQAGAARVAGREVADPEALLQLLQPRDRPAGRPQLPAGDALELAAQPLERRRASRSRARPARSAGCRRAPGRPTPRQRVGDRDREVPAGAELVEDRLGGRDARAVLLVRAEVLHRPRELLAERAVAGRQGVEARDAGRRSSAARPGGRRRCPFCTAALASHRIGRRA